MRNLLLDKIKNKKETIGVLGLGYVGLPLAVSFAELKINVIGFENSKDKIDKINSGENYIDDVSDETLSNVVNQDFLKATSDFSQVKNCDVLIICVPTPLDKFLKPDMSYIESACSSIGKYMSKETFICLESTTYPTTTEDLILPIIEKESGLKHGIDFWLAYSPERVDPGNKTFNTKNTAKVLGALDNTGLIIGEAIYSKAIEKIHKVSSPRVAEMVKILENTYRLINISMINELALLAGKMKIDIWEVIEAAKTKPFGFQAFYPGPGIGGHCIPLDPFYLEYIAKKYEFDLSMIHTAGHINMRMPHYMYIKISTALNSVKKPINGSKVLIVGVAYKANINDYRESPALKIIDKLLHKKAIVKYYDPHIDSIKITNGKTLTSTNIYKGNLKEFDVVVLTTNHNALDIDKILSESKLIVDLRNIVKVNKENIFKL